MFFLGNTRRLRSVSNLAGVSIGAQDSVELNSHGIDEFGIGCVQMLGVEGVSCQRFGFFKHLLTMGFVVIHARSKREWGSKFWLQH